MSPNVQRIMNLWIIFHRADKPNLAYSTYLRNIFSGISWVEVKEEDNWDSCLRKRCDNVSLTITTLSLVAVGSPVATFLLFADELVSIFVRSVQKDEYQICKGEEAMGKYYQLRNFYQVTSRKASHRIERAALNSSSNSRTPECIIFEWRSCWVEIGCFL